MKMIVFGLGNFGTSLCLKLTELGHEVIGVDNDMEKVNIIREKITMSVCMDSTNPSAVASLPVQDADVAIVAIGENEGDSIMTTALLKELKVKRIIGRAISPLHQTVLQAMGVLEVARPEEESAERLAHKLNLRKYKDSFELSEDFSIIEATVPPEFVGRTVLECDFRKRFNINIITILRKTSRKNIIGITHTIQEPIGMIKPDTKLLAEDILVVFGNNEGLEQLFKPN